MDSSLLTDWMIRIHDVIASQKRVSLLHRQQLENLTVAVGELADAMKLLAADLADIKQKLGTED